MIVVGPALDLDLCVELVACGFYIEGVVAVEEFVAPTVGIYAESRELAPGGY